MRRSLRSGRRRRRQRSFAQRSWRWRTKPRSILALSLPSPQGSGHSNAPVGPGCTCRPPTSSTLSLQSPHRSGHSSGRSGRSNARSRRCLPPTDHLSLQRHRSIIRWEGARAHQCTPLGVRHPQCGYPSLCWWPRAPSPPPAEVARGRGSAGASTGGRGGWNRNRSASFSCRCRRGVDARFFTGRCTEELHVFIPLRASPCAPP